MKHLLRQSTPYIATLLVMFAMSKMDPMMVLAIAVAILITELN